MCSFTCMRFLIPERSPATAETSIDDTNPNLHIHYYLSDSPKGDDGSVGRTRGSALLAAARLEILQSHPIRRIVFARAIRAAANFELGHRMQFPDAEAPTMILIGARVRAVVPFVVVLVIVNQLSNHASLPSSHHLHPAQTPLRSKLSPIVRRH